MRKKLLKLKVFKYIERLKMFVDQRLKITKIITLP